jgi:hypothetical protein
MGTSSKRDRETIKETKRREKEERESLVEIFFL